jgi:hypothetical protein
MTTMTESAEQVKAASEDVDRAISALHASREHRQGIEQARGLALTRAADGEVGAATDLERLRSEFLAARHAEQDRWLAAEAARRRLEGLRQEQGPVERGVTAEHLGAVLDVRAALAEQIEAQLGALAAIAKLYERAVAESLAVGKALGVGCMYPSMAPFVGRRVLHVLGQATPGLWEPRSFEPPLSASDVDVVKSLRAGVKRAAPTAVANGVRIAG